MQNHYLEDQMEEITYNVEWKYQKKKKRGKKDKRQYMNNRSSRKR